MTFQTLPRYSHPAFLSTTTRTAAQAAMLLLILTVTAFTLGAEETQVTQGSFNNNLNFAQVNFVKLTQANSGLWSIDVTVRHNDEGWDHYANIWQILNTDTGKILGERVLAHPHDNEQPFTRSLSGVSIPEDVNQLTVRARCNLHGYEGREVVIQLSKTKTSDYQILR